jgi:penicillin-binding protein 1A
MHRKKLKRVLGITLLVIIALPFMFYYLVLLGVWGDIPDLDQIRQVDNIQGSQVLSTDGQVIGRFYIQDRTPVTYQQISPHVINALVATEDERFYQHKGTDYRSLARVIIKTLLLQDQSSGGGSTITQQLAKNLYPRINVDFFYYPINKTREVIIAGNIEAVYSKQEILELYLNTVSFGEDVYGIESAAHRFFGKPSIDLRIEEAAVLVGMLKATTSYNPVKHPENSRSRRNVVIGQLNRSGFIADDSVEYLSDLPLITDYSPPNRGLAEYFVSQVRNEAAEIVSDYNERTGSTFNLEQSGLKIKTTLNYKMQQAAEKAVLGHMQKLQQLFDEHWPNGRLWQEQAELLERELAGVRHGRTDEELKSAREMILFNYDGIIKQNTSTIDSLQYYLQLLQTGFVSMEPQSGQIKAWVGGINYQYFPYDHVAYQAKRQVGSVFKPIIYATALEQGIAPCSYFKAEQVAYEVEEGEWSPANSGNEYEGKYTMEGALEGSINTISVKILNEVGIDNAIAMAAELGIQTELPAVPSLALGTASISLLEMVTAYSVLSNGGYQVEPFMIENIEDADGNLIYRHETTENNRVIAKETSQIMVYLLQNVVNDGTGRGIRTVYKLKNDMGGKTGTTQGNADGWFIAVTPRLVSGAWVGGIYPAISFRETRLGQGATMALPIVAGYYQTLNNNAALNSYTRARYTSIPDKLAKKLDCDPFKEQFELFQWLFGRSNRQADRVEEQAGEQKKPKEDNFFKKLGSIFKKKKK